MNTQACVNAVKLSKQLCFICQFYGCTQVLGKFELNFDLALASNASHEHIVMLYSNT